MERSLGIPSGFVELGENPTDAVLRELMEETGIKGYNPQVLTVRGNPNVILENILSRFFI